MVFGEDPSEGFVRGRRFLHPRLGFTFTAPEGFVLDNTAKAVLGVKHGGDAALRLDVVHVPAEQTLASYLTSGWIENIDPDSVHEVTINGFPGATATAKGDNWDFRLYAIRFGSDVYRFIFASKNFTAGDRPRVSRLGRHVPPDEPRRDQAGQAVAPQGRDRRARRYGREACQPHGGARPPGRALSRAQRARARATSSSPAAR